MANSKNLRPIQPGERRAAKPKSEHRSQVVAVRVTEGEMRQLKQKAKAAKTSLSKWAGARLGLDR